MKNFQKLALGLMVGAMAIGFSAFTNMSDAKFAIYRYTPAAQQNWNSTSLDQTLTNYSPVSGTVSCLPTEKICTYNISDDGVVTKNTKGTFQ